jgi:aminoglycoside phosphotransferase (APT) family kinase protein
MSKENPPGLDLGRLAGHLDRECPGLVRGPLQAEVIQGGRSNLTYRVTDGESRWVVRRPPLGHVLATAHDMAREYRVITALRGTDVPVPGTVLLCEDQDVIGAPFYVMEQVEGTPYRTAGELAALGPERTRALTLALPDTLVALHSVDPQSVGLGDFGRPEGFLESPQPTVVHGDFRLDNVLASADDRIAAVLDWEMSTLGDPLTDLGLLVMYSEPLGIPDAPVSTTAEAPGHPRPEELIERYAAASGRDVSRINWYTAFAWFKLAVILEGIHYRYTLGQTVGPGFDQIGDLVPVFIDNGLTTLRKG